MGVVMENNSEKVPPKPKQWIGVRYVQAFMLFLAMTIAYAMRVNMSLAIVAMTDTDNQNAFEWSIQKQSVILSSFFWGYVILQVPGGILASKFGGKMLILISLAVNSVVTLGIPLGAAYGGWQLLCACRVMQGLTQSFIYPSMHFLIGKWAPLEEKGRITSLIYAGSQLGTALQLVVSGFIASAWGWPAIFYSAGILGLIWTVLYCWIGSDTPQQSKIISEEERVYIQTSLGQVGGHVKHPTPWGSIWSSCPFWALIIVHCGQNWGYWTLLTEMPSYMKQVLGVDMKANGILSALPYFGLYLVSFPMAYLADLAVTKKWLSVTATRKICNTIAFWGPALALIGLSYSPSGNLMAAVMLLTITVSLNAGQFTGYLLVHIDMAPNFAGEMMGITNCIANFISLVAPLSVGLILEDETSAVEWRMVFFVSAAIYFVTNLIYLIFGTSKTQTWNEPLAKTNEITETGIAGEVSGKTNYM